MISQCCPQIQSSFVSMALLGDSKGLTDKCFGDKGSSSFLSNILSCSPFVQLTTMATNPDLLKYLTVITENSVQVKDDIKLILDICSEKEVYAIACDWNTSDLQNTCQQKLLRKWAEQGEKVYADKIQQTKDGYIKLIDVLKKEFNN